MPWTPGDAPRFNDKTRKSVHLREVWANAANAALRKYGDEGRAIRVANAAVTRAGKEAPGKSEVDGSD
jgi:hypothetical protein